MYVKSLIWKIKKKKKPSYHVLETSQMYLFILDVSLECHNFLVKKKNTVNLENKT